VTGSSLAAIAFLGIAAVTAAAMPSVVTTERVSLEQRADTGRPAVTLLYQNFPNPFPSAESRTTCIWFDLNKVASVSLTIHDARGHLVRRLLPNASSPQFLQPGRYGRATPTADQGCDPQLSWDGRADDGSTVPRGVYLIRLRVGGEQSIKKAVFQGP
jgi:hypothetical protein